MLFFSSLGAYSVNAQAFDLVLLFLLGLLGFLMRRYGLPVLPLIIGVILGPRAELHLRRTLQFSDGDISGLWSEPLAVAVYLVVGLIVLWPLINRAAAVVRR
jgi:putative tricarboxylic transport membrane protein